MSTNNENKKTRREFLGDVLWTGSVAAVGGLTCLGMSGEAKGSNAKGSNGDIRSALITLTKIDPEMILYEEIGSPVKTGLKESRFVTAAAPGLLHVVGDQCIRVMDDGGRIKDTIELTVTPFCLVSTGKQLYIGTRDRIVITDNKGIVQSTWPGLGENAWITSLAVDGENIYIADAGQRIVWCYDLKGNFIRRIGGKDPEKNIPGFVVPGPYFDLAIAPDGLLRIANPGRHRIEAYTVKGDLEFAWGRFGNRLEDFTACCNPVSFSMLADGSIITCEKGVARVKIYDASGNLKGFVAEPKQLANISPEVGIKPEQVQRYGFDVAADSHGHVYILDRARNVLRTFKARGT